MTKLTYVLRNLLVPAVTHLAIVGAYSTVDPCNNNPGCMAGTPTAIFFIVGTLPALAVLIVLNLFQSLKKHPNYAKYLTVNMVVVIVPFILAGVIYLLSKGFT